MQKILLAVLLLIAATCAFATGDQALKVDNKFSVSVHCSGALPKMRATKDIAFRCDTSLTGQCHDLVLVTACHGKAGPAASGDDICESRKLDQFDLKSGESRVARNLPENVRYCQDVNPIGGLLACMTKPG